MPAPRSLADDLHRFLEHKPVRARPVGTAERIVKWARRRPLPRCWWWHCWSCRWGRPGGVWLRQQEVDRLTAKTQREQEALRGDRTALRHANDLRREAVGGGVAGLGGRGPHLAEANSPEREERLSKAQEAFRIAQELERVREGYPLLPAGTFDYRQRATDYEKAFEQAGLRISDDPETVAAHIRTSPIRDQLVAAIEDRAFAAFMLKDGLLVERLLKSARSAEPDSPWRVRFRDPAVWRDRGRLQALATDAFTSSPPPSEYQLALLGLLLREAHAYSQSAQLLGEACRRQPRNFWVHRELGHALSIEKRYPESLAHFRAAVALRPTNVNVNERLSMCLFRLGQTDEALAACRHTIELAPTSKSARGGLRSVLASSGYWKEAEAECRRAWELDPSDSGPYIDLAITLAHYERREDAVAVYRRAIEIDPNSVQSYAALGLTLMRMARHEEAITAFQTVTRLEPANTFMVLMLVRELVAVGRWEEAITVLQTAVAREPIYYSYFLELGEIYRSHGKPEEAANAFLTAAPHFPRPGTWEGLAAARLDQGRFADARAAIETLLKLPGSDSQRQARRRLLEFCDTLLAVEARIPAILAGKERPTDVPTQRALAEWCFKHKRLTATSAGLYASAIAAQPSLANDPVGTRFDAARAAALAGCGIGADAGTLDESRRAELRKQALDWLTAEYDIWALRHRFGKPGDRTVAATAVRAWQGNEDYSGVREEQALSRLPADERRAWQTFWAKVAMLAARDPNARFVQARAHIARMEWGGLSVTPRGWNRPTDNVDLWFE